MQQNPILERVFLAASKADIPTHVTPQRLGIKVVIVVVGPEAGSQQHGHDDFVVDRAVDDGERVRATFASQVDGLDDAVGVGGLAHRVGAVDEVQEVVDVEVHPHRVLPLFDVFDAGEQGDGGKKLGVWSVGADEDV